MYMITVLVAESSLSQRNTILNIFSQNFDSYCTVQNVRNATDFYETVRTQNFNLILLDLDMPGIIWNEVISSLQEQKYDHILLPSADASSFDYTSIYNNPSVFDFILKPYSEKELILTLEEAIQYCTARSAPQSNAKSSKNEMIRKRIEGYINDHYQEIISMQDVARAMNYSDTHFCRLFKECFRINFSVYLNEFRIGKARELLLNTNYTVKEVGILCGYRDASYFIRVFKRAVGETPSDYRIHKLTMTAKKSNKS